MLKKEKLNQINTDTLIRERAQTAIVRCLSHYNLRRITSVNEGLPPVYWRCYLTQAKERVAWSCVKGKWLRRRLGFPSSRMQGGRQAGISRSR